MTTRVTACRLMMALSMGLGVIASACRAAPQPPAAGPDAPIRLYVFDGGLLESDPTRYRLTQADVGSTQLSIAAYLIVHPKGLLMWDTGAVPDDEWKPGTGPVQHRLALDDGEGRQVTLRTPLHAQLAAIGYAPADVTHLAISHHHWDHTGNANLFGGATWLVPRAEHDAMFAETPAGPVRSPTYASLKSSRAVILDDAEHDVFGDGTVILKVAPGHTAGHQVLYVKLAKAGGVVLSGDLYHYAAERALDRLPTFELNEDQTRAARRDVDVFLQTHDAQLWIQHDLPTFAKLKKSPEYYD